MMAVTKRKTISANSTQHTNAGSHLPTYLQKTRTTNDGNRRARRKDQYILIPILLLVIFYYKTQLQSSKELGDGIRAEAPVLRVKPVDNHFAWLHIEKTGSTFITVLLHYACANAPPDRTIWVGEFKLIVAEEESRCDEKYIGDPFLTASANQSKQEFHEKLKVPIYEHNKGRLIGMFREPISHRISLAKHKFDEFYEREDYGKFLSRNGFPTNDTRLSNFLQFTEGFQTSRLAGTPEFSTGINNKTADINLAKRRLTNGFQYIGITNRWAESVCLFFFKFKKPGKHSIREPLCPPAVFGAVNTAGEHSAAFNFTDEDMKYLENYDDPADREVYNHALQLFEAELHRYGVTEESCAAKGCWPGVEWESGRYPGVGKVVGP